MKKDFKMNKLFLFGVFLTFLILVIAGCGGKPAQNASDNAGAAKTEPAKTEPTKTEPAKTEPAKEEVKTITLNFAHFFPATHEIETRIVKGYIEEINKATNGRVKIVSFPAGTLCTATEIYDGVVKGVADIGMSAYSYNRGRFPVIESFILPGLEYNNSKANSTAVMEGIEKLNPKELQDVHHLLSFGNGPGDLYSKKPIRKMADLKGMAVGATAGYRADAVGLLGANPLVLPIGEWYEAFSKGVMQGGVAPIESLQGFRIGEVTADYITLTPFLYSQVLFVVMNNDKWNSLPPDIQQAFTDVSKKYFNDVWAGFFDDIDIKGMKWLKEKKKVEIITLDTAEANAWREKIKPLESKYIKYLDEKGLPGAEIMKTVHELVDKANAKFPDKAPYAK